MTPRMPALRTDVVVTSPSVATTPIRPPAEPTAWALAVSPDDGRFGVMPKSVAVARLLNAVYWLAVGSTVVATMSMLPAVIVPPTVAVTVGFAFTVAADSPTASVPAVRPAANALASGDAVADTFTACAAVTVEPPSISALTMSVTSVVAFEPLNAIEMKAAATEAAAVSASADDASFATTLTLPLVGIDGRVHRYRRRCLC